MRIILYKTNTSRRIIKDYLTRNDAINAYYEICDSKGYNYGTPTFKNVDGHKIQDGMQTKGTDYKINLYF